MILQEPDGPARTDALASGVDKGFQVLDGADPAGSLHFHFGSNMLFKEVYIFDRRAGRAESRGRFNKVRPGVRHQFANFDLFFFRQIAGFHYHFCLLYTSDAADEL